MNYKNTHIITCKNNIYSYLQFQAQKNFLTFGLKSHRIEWRGASFYFKRGFGSYIDLV